jgi:hypothetical protein
MFIMSDSFYRLKHMSEIEIASLAIAGLSIAVPMFLGVFAKRKFNKLKKDIKGVEPQIHEAFGIGKSLVS